MHTQQAFSRVLLSVTILLAAKASYAVDNLSADEIRSLLSGNKVQGEYLEGARQGITNYYAEPIIHFFTADGKVYSVKGKTKKSDNWRATEEGLCINWNNTKESCSPIYKDGDHYKLQKKNSVGKIKWSKTFTTLTPGDNTSLQDR